MTVCIAALCENGIIFGAADRMKTAADVQFEPPMPKIFSITSSIVIMTAGDSAFQAEILLEIYNVISNYEKEGSKKLWSVKEIADLYADFCNLAKLNRAERAILAPLGLDRKSFITRQNEMNESFITSITKEMLNYSVPSVSAIITGVDIYGSHIYIVNDTEVSCWDTIGFASIGIGERHAESQFMFSGHSSISPLPDVLLLTYSAKKRAEVAPGVGRETDMFMVGPETTVTMVNPNVMKKLDNEYRKIIRKENSIQKAAREEMKRYVKEIQAQASEQQSQKTTGIDGRETSTHRDTIDGVSINA